MKTKQKTNLQQVLEELEDVVREGRGVAAAGEGDTESAECMQESAEVAINHLKLAKAELMQLANAIKWLNTTLKQDLENIEDADIESIYGYTKNHAAQAESLETLVGTIQHGGNNDR